VCLPVSIAFGWFYFLVTILPQTFGSVYKFPTGSIGLCYLAGGLGNTSGSIFAGAISDKLYHKAVAKNNGEAIKEFRLRPIYIGVPLIALGAVMYGWFLHVPTHFMGPLVSYTIGKLLLFACFWFFLTHSWAFDSYIWHHVYNHSSKHIPCRL